MAGEIQLESLGTHDKAELRQLWAQHVGKNDPPALKRLVVRELAWRLQESVRGGLDAETRRLLRAAIRRAGDRSTPSNGRAARRIKVRSRPKLNTGTRLIRTWRGRTFEVVVLDDGKRFEYRGQVYRSLTEIAEKITGAHWSGPRFFGLHRVRAVG